MNNNYTDNVKLWIDRFFPNAHAQAPSQIVYYIIRSVYAHIQKSSI